MGRRLCLNMSHVQITKQIVTCKQIVNYAIKDFGAFHAFANTDNDDK